MTKPWVGRRVLVTGATGIVGGHLCEKLIGLGAYVVALVRDDDPMSSLYRDGIVGNCSIVRGDLRSFETCMRSINAHDIDTVFHLGAQTLVETAMRDPLETFESNLRGTYNLLEAARRVGIVKAFIVASSDKAYGDSDILPYTEDMPLVGRHPYDVSKSCTDLLSTCYSISYDLPVTIARCGNIYGSGDLNWSRIVPGTIRSIIAGQRPVLRSNGSNIRDYIYVSDVVSAYIKLAEQIDQPHVRGEAFNFSPETRVDVFEMVSAIASAMDSNLKPIVLDTATHEIKVQTLDSSKARRILGWAPTWSLDAALRETIPWYQRLLADK